MTSIFTNISTEFTYIVRKIRLTNVKIRSGDIGIGSGVIWSNGLIITNAHVAFSNRLTVDIWDGREFAAVRTRID
ncbi:MAG: hypothetical protein AAF378_13580 [Cyanobacteria bacterium P01_A01_bin.84]